MKTTVTKHHWFWPWQDEKEEKWLQDMAKSGLHLSQPGYLGSYVFEQRQPRNDVYRLDFQNGGKKKLAAYKQLFQDAGWEWVAELGGWQYFRKTVPAGERAEIFTDNTSKVEKYRRVFLYLLLILLVLFTSTFVVWSGGRSVPGVLRAIVYACFILYVYILARLWMRMQELRKNL